MLTRSLRRMGKRNTQKTLVDRSAFVDVASIQFDSPVEASRRGEGLERQLVAPKQVVSIEKESKGLDCNSPGCDHCFQLAEPTQPLYHLERA